LSDRRGVVQWLEYWSPKPKIWVRFLSPLINSGGIPPIPLHPEGLRRCQSQGGHKYSPFPVLLRGRGESEDDQGMKIRNSIVAIANEYLVDSPAPRNLNYMWNFGSLLGLNLIILIISGITLAMHYTPEITLAFTSVEHIMRDVNNGWLIRYIHANGASFFFIWVYLHIGRGLYYGSYKSPRGLLWIIGVIIYFIMMATAF
jgi:hypothetical protein